MILFHGSIFEEPVMEKKELKALDLPDRFLFAEAIEEPETMELIEDEATRIFLNTRGTNPEGVSHELIELLEYFEHSTDETGR